MSSLVKILLHCDGADASTSFPDSSNYAHSLTTNVNSQVDTAQSKFGGAAYLGAANGDLLTMLDSEELNLAANDFTIDVWVRFSSLVLTVFFEQFLVLNRSISIYWNTDNTLHFAYSPDGTTSIDTGRSWTPSADTWYHIALVREGDTAQLFIDGVILGASYDLTGVTINNSSAPVSVFGSVNNANQYCLVGWADEFDFVNGEARWPVGSNFTPPTQAYTLTTPLSQMMMMGVS